MNDQDFQNNWVDGKTWIIGSPTVGDSSMQNGDVVRFTSSNGVKGVEIVHTEDSNSTVDEWATCCWLDGDDLVGVKVFRITLDASAELTCRFVDDPLVPLTVPDPANPASPPRLVGFLSAPLAAPAFAARPTPIRGGIQPSTPTELPGGPANGAHRIPRSSPDPQPGGNGGQRDVAGVVFVATEGGPITTPPHSTPTETTTA